MITDAIEIDDIPFDVTDDDVWSMLGTPGRPHPGLVDEVAKYSALARELAEPRALVRYLDVLEGGRRAVSFVDGPTIEGKFLAHLFEGASSSAFMLVTIGPALETRVAEMMSQGDNVEAIVLDAAGSAAAMSLLTHVLQHVYEDADKQGLNVGTCCTPGQSFWDMEGQGDIFDALQGHRLGIELLESKFMRPQKSQSAMLPLGTALKVHGDPSESYCRYCPATNCPVRKEPQVALKV